MKRLDKKVVPRVLITLLILLSGLAMIPFVELPTAALGWELFAGIYTPDLTVNQTSGAPGSVFAFTGTNYPANSLANIYVDGNLVGTVMTDGAGKGSFLIDTRGSIPGQYNVTMEVDINASATQGIDLIAGGTIVVPPPGFPGPTFLVGHPVFLPAVLSR